VPAHEKDAGSAGPKVEGGADFKAKLSWRHVERGFFEHKKRTKGTISRHSERIDEHCAARKLTRSPCLLLDVEKKKGPAAERGDDKTQREFPIPSQN